MATVKTGTLYFWSWPPGLQANTLVGTYVLGRREWPWQPIERFAKQGGIWFDFQSDSSAFTPWHEINRVTLKWEKETISEELAHKLIAEGRVDVVLGEPVE